MAIASRAAHPSNVRGLLGLIRVDEARTVLDVIDGPVVVMGGGTKRHHFRKIQAVTGVRFEDMVFYDDVGRHVVDVSGLGVTAVRCPVGLNVEKLVEGLHKHGEQVSAPPLVEAALGAVGPPQMMKTSSGLVGRSMVAGGGGSSAIRGGRSRRSRARSEQPVLVHTDEEVQLAAALVFPLLAYKVSALVQRVPLMRSLDVSIALATVAMLAYVFI